MVEYDNKNRQEAELTTVVELPNRRRMVGLQARAFVNLLTAESPEATLNIGTQWSSIFGNIPYNRTRISTLYNKMKAKLGDLGTIQRYEDPNHTPQFADTTLSSHFMPLQDGVREKIEVYTAAKVKPHTSPEIPRVELPNDQWAIGNEARLYLELLKDHLNPKSAIPSSDLYRIVYDRDGYNKSNMNALVHRLRQKLEGSGIAIKMKYPTFEVGTGRPHPSVYLDCGKRIVKARKQYFKESIDEITTYGQEKFGHNPSPDNFPIIVARARAFNTQHDNYLAGHFYMRLIRGKHLNLGSSHSNDQLFVAFAAVCDAIKKFINNNESILKAINSTSDQRVAERSVGFIDLPYCVYVAKRHLLEVGYKEESKALNFNPS